MLVVRIFFTLTFATYEASRTLGIVIAISAEEKWLRYVLTDEASVFRNITVTDRSTEQSRKSV